MRITLLLPLLMTGCLFSRTTPLSRDPLTADEHVRLGDIYRSRGDAEGALAEYRMAAAADPDHLLTNRRLAMHAIGEEAYEEAAGFLERILAATPDDPISHDTLAWVLWKSGTDPERAESLAARGVDLADVSIRPRCLWTLARIRAQRGAYEEAIDTLDRAIEGLPDGPELVEMKMERAAWGFRAGRDEEARRDLERLLARVPEDGPEASRIRRMLRRGR